MLALCLGGLAFFYYINYAGAYAVFLDASEEQIEPASVSSTDKAIEITEEQFLFLPEIMAPSSSVLSSSSSLSIDADSASSTSFFVSSSPVCQTDKIKLNEMVSSPVEDNEWVELYSLATTSLDLSGWQICDATGKSCKSIIGMIDAQSWLVIDLQTNRYLNNDQDSVILLDACGQIVDQLDYGQEIKAPNQGESLIRFKDGQDAGQVEDWLVTDNISKGAINIAPSQPAVKDQEDNDVLSDLIPDTSNQPIVAENILSAVQESSAPEAFDYQQKIILTKIFPDPAGSDLTGEYIAIKNVSSSSLDMAGLKLSDVGKSFALFGLIEAGQEIIWSRASTSLALNNTTAETISLTDLSDNIIDQIGYSQAGEGRVLQRNHALEWEWVDDQAGAKQAIGASVIDDGQMLESVIDDEYEAETSASSTAEDGIKKEKMTIEQARASGLKKKLTVRGVVSVLPNVFSSQYLYILDETGGIQIYNYKKEFPVLAVGNYVEITGEIAQSGNMIRIKTAGKNDIQVLAPRVDIKPMVLAINEIGEDSLGGFVGIRGMITSLKSNYMYVDDGEAEITVYFKANAKIDKKTLLVGQSVVISGIVEKNKTEIQLWPRSQADIQVVVAPVEALFASSTNPLNITATGTPNSSLQTTEKYLALTAGGLSTVVLGWLVRARGVLLWNGTKKVGMAIAGLIRKG